MKTKPVLIGLAFLLLAATLPASAARKIRVITSLPELAEFTRAVGGDLVEVESLATGVEDPHGVPMKPSFVPKLSRADLVVILGLELEHAFMPALIEASKNPKIQAGKPGYIDCSLHIAPLEVPKSLSRTEGEIHPNGNPHYNLDPVLARTAIQTIYDGLVQNFPEHQAAFKAGRDAYLAKLDKKIAEWQALAKPLKGVKFISYHNEWPYFNHRYGLTYLGTIELRHGIEPTARHVVDTIALVKAEQCKIVVREPQFSERVPEQIAAQTGAKVVSLPIMAGGPRARTYMELIDFDIRSLLAVAKDTAVATK
jgi:zinc/manganese transport system substrate-binding protein